MKITIVSPEHPLSPLHGGIGRYLRDYIPELAKYHDVLMISIEDGEEMNGVKQVIIPKSNLPSPLKPFALSKAINKVLKNFQPDCVEYANWLGLGCCDKGSWAKIVRLSTPVIHGTLKPGLLPKIARPFHHHWELHTVKNADIWISNTHQNLATCETVYKIKKDNFIINHGLNLPINKIEPTNKDILFVGRFESRKGVDILLEAWEIVCKDSSYDERKLHLVGRDMPGASGSYLQDCLQKFSPPEKSYIVHGGIDESDLMKLRKECLIALIPSRYESFGMVALEAFASGHAVISSRTGGLTEIVTDENNGLLFENENSQDLADTILKLIKNRNLTIKLAEHGQLSLIENFSMKTMVEKSIKAYEYAINLKSKS